MHRWGIKVSRALEKAFRRYKRAVGGSLQIDENKAPPLTNFTFSSCDDGGLDALGEPITRESGDERSAGAYGGEPAQRTK